MAPVVTWLGHASFRIEFEGKAIYIDPWKVKGGPKADLILITHTHFDHMSPDDIRSLSDEDTKVIGPKDLKEKVPEAIILSPGAVKTFGGIKIETHRAYNPKKEFHPKTNDWLGYVVDMAGYRVYHSGDTDVIPEMKDVGNIDVALLPIGGTYTMTPEEAAKAVSMIGPKTAIPMHWGDIIGSSSDAEKFKALASCKVVIQSPSH